MNIQSIVADCGISIRHYERVHGGDINDAYCLHSDDRKYFLKINDASRYPGMFEMEAAGLETLRAQGYIKIPKVLKYSIIAGQQYLLLEWIAKGQPCANYWSHFGESLARIHQQPQQQFGWTNDNYIGSLIQVNSTHEHWQNFYTNCRIMPLVQQLFASHLFSYRDVVIAEKFCGRIPSLFPVEPPALLHGDLWSGNCLAGEKGLAVIYDPAIYCGHREMEIGMTKLFGGFDRQFYEAYDACYPLQKDWQQRLPLTQLYPILVHAILFGGHYISSARDILQEFA